MQATLTPVAEAFHNVPEARPMCCGINAHLIDPSHIEPARAWRHERHDRISGARYTGWYADSGQFEILTGYVYAFAEDDDDEDDDPTPTYYALVESTDTDCHYLDPDAYDDPATAARAADRMAELLAELERECDEVRCIAGRARSDLARRTASAARRSTSCATSAPVRPTPSPSVPRSRGCGGNPTPDVGVRSI